MEARLKTKKKMWDDTGKSQGVAEISIVRNRRRGHLHSGVILKESMVKRLTVSPGPRASAKQDKAWALLGERGCELVVCSLVRAPCGGLYKQAFAGMLSSDSTAIHSE